MHKNFSQFFLRSMDVWVLFIAIEHLVPDGMIGEVFP